MALSDLWKTAIADLAPGQPTDDDYRTIAIDLLNKIALGVGSTGTGATKFPAQGAQAFAKSQAVAGAKKLYSVTGYNSNASAQYILLFDLAALPANGTIPLLALQAVGKNAFSWDFGPEGMSMAAGVVVANSSNDTSLTLGGAADCLFCILTN